MPPVDSTKKPEPFLKWAGGKAQLLKQFEELDLFPNQKRYDRYFEPFLGGGAVFFHLQPRRAIISDLNEDLIKCYKVIKKNPDSLIKSLNRGNFKNNRSVYNVIRKKYNDEQFSDIERAAALIYLNKTCFNGLYRVNNSGEFNVPFGDNHYQSLYQAENIRAVSQSLKNASLKTGSFEKILKNVRRGDFVYLDPPYYPIKNLPPNFTKYTKLSFLKKEQQSLAKLFSDLNDRGALVMLSNSDSRNVRKLYKGFRIVKVIANRLINCDGEKRGAIDEIVVLNYF
jgi:DNA adenine methylase